MIPNEIGKEHILSAIKEIGKSGIPERRKSTKYDLVYNGKRYPPKYVISIANKYLKSNKLMYELPANEFNGGYSEANKFIIALGFNIQKK